MQINNIFRIAVTGTVFLVAILASWLLWRFYMYSSWTRDGRVRADVVTIAPDVSGLVVQVAVKDNQRVKKGDLLLVIDQERYRLTLSEAEALVASAGADARRLRTEAERRSRVGNDVVSREMHEQAEAAAAVAEAQLAKVEAQRDLARLNLERTRVLSPVDGYVTNLSVFQGDYANAGSPRLAVIDEHSFWICGYFEETKISRLKAGDRADIELVSGGPPFQGRVEGIARGIGERDNPTGEQLLVNTNPTYNWVRLAQRIPVRISIAGEVPENLAMGMSCTVVIKPGE